jgi:hypothetical protein
MTVHAPHPPQPRGANGFPAKPLSLDELLAAPQPGEGDWGPWVLDTDARSIVLAEDADLGTYDVRLDRCCDAADVLDWIVQIAGKEWADDRVTAGLVRALDDVLRLQANVCPWGKPREISSERLTALIVEATRRFPEYPAAARTA